MVELSWSLEFEDFGNHKKVIRYFYIILFFKKRKLISLQFLINEIFHLNDMVSKILNSIDQFSSTECRLRLNRM